MVLDLSVEEQIYVEDCEVCCRPIQIGHATENNELKDFWADSLEE